MVASRPLGPYFQPIYVSPAKIGEVLAQTNKTALETRTIRRALGASLGKFVGSRESTVARAPINVELIEEVVDALVGGGLVGKDPQSEPRMPFYSCTRTCVVHDLAELARLPAVCFYFAQYLRSKQRTADLALFGSIDNLRRAGIAWAPSERSHYSTYLGADQLVEMLHYDSDLREATRSHPELPGGGWIDSVDSNHDNALELLRTERHRTEIQVFTIFQLWNNRQLGGDRDPYLLWIGSPVFVCASEA